MTTRQADRIIKREQPVTVHNTRYNETFTALFLRRDRYLIYSKNGVFERADLELLPEPKN